VSIKVLLSPVAVTDRDPLEAASCHLRTDGHVRIPTYAWCYVARHRSV